MKHYGVAIDENRSLHLDPSGLMLWDETGGRYIFELDPKDPEQWRMIVAFLNAREGR